MIQFIAVLTTLARARVQEARRNDDGASALEMVVIGGILLAAAIFVGLAVRAAIDARIGGIA